VAVVREIPVREIPVPRIIGSSLSNYDSTDNIVYNMAPLDSYILAIHDE
jgi:hypothetical protein